MKWSEYYNLFANIANFVYFEKNSIRPESTKREIYKATLGSLLFLPFFQT